MQAPDAPPTATEGGSCCCGPSACGCPTEAGDANLNVIDATARNVVSQGDSFLMVAVTRRPRVAVRGLDPQRQPVPPPAGRRAVKLGLDPGDHPHCRGRGVKPHGPRHDAAMPAN